MTEFLEDIETEEETDLTEITETLVSIENNTQVVNEHLEQIDATLKIFFVIICIFIFSKIFINTFFKGW